MQALVVDLDEGDISAKRDHLIRNLGPATLTIESGGLTKAGQPKLHLWWKLTEPAEGEDLARLCQLRATMALKVGGDDAMSVVLQIWVAGTAKMSVTLHPLEEPISPASGITSLGQMYDTHMQRARRVPGWWRRDGT
ncbi:hypothetical protein DPM13_15800 [Paracoccus mutanolyticus]|uniref:Uncharacterized protein n=1 Tax=Paracoccus mutanolyticus TaxID=1499308 RepID=A0ABN5MA72_9RHOB|nr:hypothetical protein [Paracoccus mutanolyticus]AWX93943.1 hypothetical protein DPM13_15800 [Paracoccus mutanolyticus]